MYCISWDRIILTVSPLREISSFPSLSILWRGSTAIDNVLWMRGLQYAIFSVHGMVKNYMYSACFNTIILCMVMCYIARKLNIFDLAVMNKHNGYSCNGYLPFCIAHFL